MGSLSSADETESSSSRRSRRNDDYKRRKLIDDPDYRNWLSLPDDLLRSVADRVFISSYRDNLAFAAVCTAWRSFAGPLPPLLLHFNPWGPSAPPQFKTLSSSTSPLDYTIPTLLRSHLPIQDLWLKPCVGYSHRHLIFASRQPLLVDVFTGYNITIPHRLPLNYSRFDIAILTAPPSRPGAVLLLLDWALTDLLYITAAHDHWSVLRLDGVPDPKILSLCADTTTKHSGKVYGLLSAGRVFVINTNDMSWELLDMAELPEASNVLKKPSMRTKVEHILQLNRNLVQCDGELMLILMAGAEGGLTEWRCQREWRLAAIKTYRLDFVQRTWVEVEGIGDWCLFMDVVGRCRVAPCRDPYRWGGKSNCIYVAGGFDSWREIPADGTPFGHGFICPSRWPSPIWVHPTD